MGRAVALPLDAQAPGPGGLQPGRSRRWAGAGGRQAPARVQRARRAKASAASRDCVGRWPQWLVGNKLKNYLRSNRS